MSNASENKTKAKEISEAWMMMADFAIEQLILDAQRWRWLRQRGGWPDSETAMMGATPEDFDKMADEGIAREKQPLWVTAQTSDPTK